MANNQRCPLCNSDGFRLEPEWDAGAHSFSCGTVFRGDGTIAFRWGTCYNRSQEWLRQQLDDLRSQIERLRQEKTALAQAYADLVGMTKYVAFLSPRCDVNHPVSEMHAKAISVAFLTLNEGNDEPALAELQAPH